MKVALCIALLTLFVFCNGKALEDSLEKRAEGLNDFIESNDKDLREENNIHALLKWRNWVAVTLEWTEFAIEKLKAIFPIKISSKWVAKLEVLKGKLLKLAELMDNANENFYAAIKKALEDAVNLWKALYNQFFWWAPLMHFSLPTFPRTLPTRPFVATTAAAIIDEEVNGNNGIEERGILKEKLAPVIEQLINKVDKFLPELEKMPNTQKLVEEARKVIQEARDLLEKWKQAVKQDVDEATQMVHDKVENLNNKLKECYQKLQQLIFSMIYRAFGSITDLSLIKKIQEIMSQQ